MVRARPDTSRRLDRLAAVGRSWNREGPVRPSRDPIATLTTWTAPSEEPGGNVATCLLAERTPLSPVHLDSDRIRGFEGAFARRSAIEIELHWIGHLDSVAVAGQ